MVQTVPICLSLSFSFPSRYLTPRRYIVKTRSKNSTGASLLTKIQTRLEQTSFSISAQSDPKPSPGNHAASGQGDSCCPLACDRFRPCTICMPLSVLRVLVKYFIECPSIGVCLMLFSGDMGLGEEHHQSEVASTSHTIGGT